MSPVTVTVLGRPGCHLCDEATEQLREYLAGNPGGIPDVEVEEINIESDDQLHLEFLERIPVIQVAGKTVSELWFDAEALTVALGHRPRSTG